MRNNSPDSRTMSFAVFKQRFIDYLVGRHPVEQIAYGKSVKDYAAGVAYAYWIASQDDGRSPEEGARDDIEFWATDHATPTVGASNPPVDARCRS